MNWSYLLDRKMSLSRTTWRAALFGAFTSCGRYLPLLWTLVGSKAGCLTWSPIALGVCAFSVTNEPTPAVTDTQPTLDSTTSAALVSQPIPLIVKSCDASGGNVAMRSSPPTGTCESRPNNGNSLGSIKRFANLIYWSERICRCFILEKKERPKMFKSVFCTNLF